MASDGTGMRDTEAVRLCAHGSGGRFQFEEIAKTNAIPKGVTDFGVYNNSLLYVTEYENGKFTKDDSSISHYLMAIRHRLELGRRGDRVLSGNT
jgi:hypothetical protein